MKEALSVVVLLIVIAPAFAADVVWENGLPPMLVPWVEPPAKSAQPQVKTQNAQQSSQNMPPSVIPQPRPDPGQASSTSGDKYSEQQLKIDREANDIQWLLVWVGVFTAVTQFVFIIIQLYYLGAANKHAAEAADAAKESAEAARKSVEIADHALKASDRADLSIGWDRIEGLQPNTAALIHFNVANVGRVPTVIVAEGFDYFLDMERPLRVPKFEHLIMEAVNTPLAVQEKVGIPVRIDLIDSATFELIGEGQLHIHFYGRLVHEDKLGLKHDKHFCVRYDIGEKKFFLVQQTGYNYTITEEKKPKK